MKKFLFLILSSFLFSFCVFAKEATPACTLTLKDLPKIRGIWLGMSEEEFLSVVPTAKKNENFGEGVGEVDYSGLPVSPSGSSADYDLIDVHSVDGHISFFSLAYPNYSPVSAIEFVKQAAETLQLPMNGWKKDGKEARVLDCTEFSIEVQTGRNGRRIDYPALILTDKVADTKINDRLKQKKRIETEKRQRQEQESRIFHP